MKYTADNNLGGSTQFNFWYNQDASYGEGYADGPISTRSLTTSWMSSL